MRRFARSWPFCLPTALVLAVVLTGPGAADAETTPFFQAAAIAILDDAAANPYPSTIEVSGIAGAVTRVNVTLFGFTHPQPQDVDILLVGPDGQTVMLMSDAGRDDPAPGLTLTFQDGASPLPNRHLTSGTFRPTNRKDRSGTGNDTFPGPAPGGPYGTALSAFNAVDPNGTWSLFVRDDRATGSGTISGGWCLAITTGAFTGQGGCIPTLTVVASGPGTVTSVPGGISCGADCSESYPPGTEVTLTATPDPSFEFTGWSGGGCAGTAPCQVTMNGDVSVTATFAPPAGDFTLTVATVGHGSVASAPTGIACGADCVEAYASGTVVTLTATPDPSFVFTGWSGGGCSGTAPCQVTVSGDVSVTATFAPPAGAFALEVTAVGAGVVTSNPVGITCGGDCAEAYLAGTLVTLTATPAASFVFAGWSGGGCSGTDPCQVTMSSDQAVTATFEPPAGSFTLAVTVEGQGTVTSDPVGIACGSDCAEAYPVDTEVTLTAVPEPGFDFAGWTGGGCTGTDPCTVALSEDTEVTATFVAPPGQFTLRVQRVGSGSVTSAPAGIDCGSDCAQAYLAGTVVTLTATPDPSFLFAGWSGGGCSGTGPCQVVLSANLVVSAAFAAPPGSFALAVQKIGPGAGVVTSVPDGIGCGSDCAQAYLAGTVVTLTAAPDPSFLFAGWSGGGCSGTGPCQVTVSTDVVVQATFAAPPGSFALTVTRPGQGLGRVTSQPAGVACGPDCAQAYPAGTAVTLTAVGRRGSTFRGWTGAGCAGTGPCQVTLDAHTEVAATFDPPPDRSLLVTPEEDDPSIQPGDLVSLHWTPVANSSQQGIEYSAPNGPFLNPLGALPDGVNGYGGAGGGFIVPGTSFSFVVDPGTPPGTYQVRPVSLDEAGNIVGRFGDAVTFLVGGIPGGQPAFTSPADGTPFARGGPAAFSWTGVAGAAQYLFTYEGGPDPGLIGGGFLVPTPDVAGIIPATTPVGTYRVRVIALTAAGAPIGQFSLFLTVQIQ